MIPLATTPEALPAARFGDWIESLGAGVAGCPDEPGSCPLARWLRARVWPQAIVTHGRYQPVPGAPWVALPAWAVRFEALALGEGRAELSAVRAGQLLRRAVREGEGG